MRQIRSSDNPTDLFTKSLPASTLEKIVHKIGMRNNHPNRDFYQGGVKYTLYSFFLSLGFVPLSFPRKVFNEAENNAY